MCKWGTWSCGLNNKRQKTEAGSSDDRVFTLCQSVLQLRPTVATVKLFPVVTWIAYTFLHGSFMKELLVLCRTHNENFLYISWTLNDVYNLSTQFLAYAVVRSSVTKRHRDVSTLGLLSNVKFGADLVTMSFWHRHMQEPLNINIFTTTDIGVRIHSVSKLSNPVKYFKVNWDVAKVQCKFTMN